MHAWMYNHDYHQGIIYYRIKYGHWIRLEKRVYNMSNKRKETTPKGQGTATGSTLPNEQAEEAG